MKTKETAPLELLLHALRVNRTEEDKKKWGKK
mgnify:CR=1 FL=1